MYILLVSLVIGLFVAMLFVNIYFRVRVLKAYKKLVQARVEFKPIHVINRSRMEKEIFPKYPEQREDIEVFVRHLFFSVRMASVLIALITLFGAVLMWYR
ncbi:MAG: hypothetical protein AAF990_06680 [Bacteroidota bacterium]